MTQSSRKRDTKSKSHPSVKLAPVRVFSFKHPLSSLCRENRFGVRILYYCMYQTSQWLLCNLATIGGKMSRDTSPKSGLFYVF